MSIYLKRGRELRYANRPDLEQESKIMGNYYRDIIRSYGQNVVYQKLDTSVFENYKQTIDMNAVLQQAYGYNMNPDYSCSANMISYIETDQDILVLNRTGIQPNQDLNFYFDSIDFACDLATKLGQYEEFKLPESEIYCEVPECSKEIVTAEDPETGNMITSYLSSAVYPYIIGLGDHQTFKNDALSGSLSVEIPGYDLEKEYTVQCDVYEHSPLQIAFPANEHLYRSLLHHYKSTEKLDSAVFLTYKVSKVQTDVGIDGQPEFKYILKGRLHGSILFYNIFKRGKQLELIHPEVGDLITLDYPHDDNKQVYEIVDCYDSSLQSDGISPLLHKYVWKCKARRYIGNYENLDQQNDDKIMLEKKLFEQQIDEKVTKLVSEYPDNEDAAYGGYEAKFENLDHNIPDPKKKHEMIVLDATQPYIEIFRFGCGSRLLTDGYELMFVNADNGATKLHFSNNPKVSPFTAFESGLKFIKASDEELVFVDIAGDQHVLAHDEEATQNDTMMCLNSMVTSTLDADMHANRPGNFYKFKETQTILFASDDSLFCKLSSNGKLYRLV